MFRVGFRIHLELVEVCLRLIKGLFRESKVSLGLVSGLFRADLRCIYSKVFGLKCIYGCDNVCLGFVEGWCRLCLRLV